MPPVKRMRRSSRKPHQVVSGKLIYSECEFVALLSSHRHIIRCDFIWIQITKQRRLIRRVEYLTRRTCHTGCRAISLKTAVTAASARASVLLHDDMTELTGETITSVNKLSVNDNTRAHTCSKRNNNEVFIPRATP